MQINVTGRHVEVSDEVKGYVEEKASRLPRFLDKLHTVDVILGHESDEFTVEMIAHADGCNPFVAREIGPDTFALVDIIVDKLERQLTKQKEKWRKPKHEPRDDSVGLRD